MAALVERIANVQGQVTALAGMLDRRLDALTDLIDIRFRAVGDEMAKQERIDDYNKEQQNEWRGTLGDLATRMATKAELAALQERVNVVDSTVTAMPSRSDIDRQFDTYAERVSKLEAYAYQWRGTVEQRQESKTTTLTIASIIAVVVSAIVGALAATVLHNMSQGLK